MLCETVLGNVQAQGDRFAGSARHIDWIDIHWWELERRALSKSSRQGRLLRILLSLGQEIRDGDVVFDDGATIGVVRVVPCEVLVISPATISDAALLALELGNLHAPTQIVSDGILVIPDGPIEAVLSDLGLTYERQMRRFEPRRCAGMPALKIAPNLEVRT